MVRVGHCARALNFGEILTSEIALEFEEGKFHDRAR
jgi:hypothetical protein